MVKQLAADVIYPRRMISIDPGDVHVGVCKWEKPPEGWLLVGFEEMTPVGVVQLLERELGGPNFMPPIVGLIIVEQFRLYAHLAQEMAFHEMHTSELIGVIKYLTLKAGVDYVGQPATIKDPTRAIAKAKGMAEPDGSRHVKDAWLHGCYYTLRDKAA